jgi:uncharacterized integral membrane protein
MAQPPENRPAATPDEPLPSLPTRFSTESDLPPADSSPGSPAGASPGPSTGLEPSPDLAPPPAVPEQPFGVSDETTVRRERIKVPWTRTSAAWLGIWAGVAALILLIIFVAQNTANVQINFLWMSGHFSLAVALLVAGVCGAIIAMAVAAARIVQLRRLVHRGR